MSKNQTQSFENHSRLIPLWHFVTAAVIVVIVVHAVFHVFTEFSFDALIGLAGALVLALIWVFARVFALTAQDRLIRLEETLRFERLLSDDLKSRINEITLKQFIALRFASDEEVGELVGKVLSGDLTEQKEIKKAIKHWRADHERV